MFKNFQSNSNRFALSLTYFNHCLGRIYNKKKFMFAS